MKSSLFNRFVVALALIDDALREPVDFISLQMTFGSGSRQLAGQAQPADAAARTFRYRLPGKSGTADAAGMIQLIREACLMYDTCRLELRQRGQNRFFEADGRNVRMGSLAAEPEPAERDEGEGISVKRDYLIQVSEAAALLQAIGITDAQGRLRNDKIRKYHQIDRFVELADPILRELLAAPDSLHVVDLACGKSYLSFVLNYYIREKLGHACHFTGIDLAPGVVGSSRDLAARLGYRNMQFEQGDLRTVNLKGQPDLCISLHACDTATDLALAAAVRARSRAIIVVPCCQRELLASDYRLPDFAGSILAHGVLKARMADLLTDALRLLLLRAAGYESSLIEYISPLDTPKNLMIRSRYTGSRDERAIREYKELTAQLGQTITLGRYMEETDYGRHPGLC